MIASQTCCLPPSFFLSLRLDTAPYRRRVANPRRTFADAGMALGSITTFPPPAGTTGTYTDIAIAVSDGELKTALPPFSIKVTTSSATTSTSSATLSWSAPTQNEDGSPLTDLAGYRIHYGTSASNLSKRVVIGNPATTSTVVQSLTTGTWYFAISAYTQTGAESLRSAVVSKVIG